MGRYDIFHGKYKCPHCGIEQEFKEYSKDYAGDYEDYLLGDYITTADQNCFYTFNNQCVHCGEETYLSSP